MLTPHSHSRHLPHYRQYLGLGPDGAEEGDHNYCRNPDDTDGGPYCFTTDSETRWETCGIKHC